jgi:hypothetical protein
VPPSKAVGRYSYQLVALSDMMETGAQGFPPKNGPPVFQAAEDKAPGLQPASVQQHGASAPKTLTAGAAGATGAASIQLMQYDPGSFGYKIGSERADYYASTFFIIRQVTCGEVSYIILADR